MSFREQDNRNMSDVESDLRAQIAALKRTLKLHHEQEWAKLECCGEIQVHSDKGVLTLINTATGHRAIVRPDYGMGFRLEMQ